MMGTEIWVLTVMVLTVFEKYFKFIYFSGSLKNWSKYALWCTDKKTWLIAPRATLNTYGLDAGMYLLLRI